MTNGTRTFHRYPPAMRITCPRCNAGPAQRCRSKRGGRSSTIHALRTALAEGRIGYRCHCTRIWPTYTSAERCSDTHPRAAESKSSDSPTENPTNENRPRHRLRRLRPQ